MTHVPGNKLQKALDDARALVCVGATYVHYKDPQHRYTVLCLGIMEADDTLAVIYQAQYGEKLTFIRPLTSWLETVVVGEQRVPRFAVLTDTECK